MAAQLAAVSYLARYSGHTHDLYAYQLRRWFEWCQGNSLDPLVGIQRAHVELYIHLGEVGLMPPSINTTMHGVRGFFRFAHIDGQIPADPAVYARLPEIHQDESHVCTGDTRDASYHRDRCALEVLSLRLRSPIS